MKRPCGSSQQAFQNENSIKPFCFSLTGQPAVKSSYINEYALSHAHSFEKIQINSLYSKLDKRFCAAYMLTRDVYSFLQVHVHKLFLPDEQMEQYKFTSRSVGQCRPSKNRIIIQHTKQRDGDDRLIAIHDVCQLFLLIIKQLLCLTIIYVYD